MRKLVSLIVAAVVLAAGFVAARMIRIERSPGPIPIDQNNMPYAGFSTQPARPDHKGVMVHDAAEAWAGYNLFVLQELNHVLHLSWDSKLLAWSRLVAHHDIAPVGDGTFVTLVNDVRETRGRRARFSRLARLSSDLRVTGGGSTFDLQATFPNPRLRDHDGEEPFDYYHENTVAVIGPNAAADTDPAWRPGNLIVCLRNVDRVVVLDPAGRKALWSWGAGELEMPHHPTVLPSGRVLVFDNGVRRKRSRVVEVDPATKRIVWTYPPAGGASFFTAAGGSAQRLPNGNTLVCDSDNGRAFEVTPAGRTVWEFLHPITQRDTQGDGQWHRARIYRMLRYAPSLVDPLLARHPPRPDRPPWWAD